MEPNTEQQLEQLKSIVGRVMQIEAVVIDPPEIKAVAEYRGRLTKDSMEAYDQLAEAVKPYGLTPMMKNDRGQHVVILLDVVIDPPKSNPWVNLILFILTIFSVLFAGTIYSYDGPMPDSIFQFVITSLTNLNLGVPYAASILAILLAHEFGHYLAARYHKTPVSLPYFIPFPLSSIGTMGAFISLKAPPKNKRVLHDIGVAGPLAGLVVAIPILLIGQALSPIETIPLTVPDGLAFSFEGNSLLYLAIKYIVHGELLPAPASYGGVAPVLYWLKYFFTGLPLPVGGRDAIMHPIAWAGWVGLLVTALNLIPAGQLDGGHALYVLLGDKANRAWRFIVAVLAVLGVFWPGWWLWVGLIFVFGRMHAEPFDQITELDTRRKVIAILIMVIFVLVFIPIPFQQMVAV